MMLLTGTIDIFEVVWVAVAVFGLFYCLSVRSDAKQDLRARHAAGVNSGREELAQLLVITTSLTAFAFTVWLACGLLLFTVPASLATSPSGYVVKVGIIAAEIAIALAQFFKQRVRRHVLLRDMRSDAIQAAAAALLASQERQQNTQALLANTAATEAATHALQNGPMTAQIAQTTATEELTDATDELKVVTEKNTASIDISIKARQGDTDTNE